MFVSSVGHQCGCVCLHVINFVVNVFGSVMDCCVCVGVVNSIGVVSFC